MSETEHFKGKLTSTGKSVDEYMQDVELDKWCDTKQEMFNDMSDEAIEIDGVVFEVSRESVDVLDDIMIASKNEDGSYSFEVKYYNGGCGFSEAIEESLSNANS